MLIGIPKEIKPDEYRVGLIPDVVGQLTAKGHDVLVETGAGAGAGLGDADYAGAGARIVADARQIFAQAELIVKVKEPLALERKQLRRGQTIFTYLHLAADPEQTRELVASGVTAIAYETVTDAAGKLPLLTPMSIVAGRMAAQVAAHFLQRPHGGRGILLGGVSGVPVARTVILGGGIVGSNAADAALGMGANVVVAVHRADTADRLSRQFGHRADIVVASPKLIASLCLSADAVIGAALIPGAAAPRLISAATVRQMKAGAVIVDVSIDQGGCAETSHPTTHSNPTFIVDDVVHYCVANMPGAVPRTSTFALSDATGPYVMALAEKGVTRALIDDEHLRNGLNVYAGQVTYRAVADALGLSCSPPLPLLIA